MSDTSSPASEPSEKARQLVLEHSEAWTYSGAYNGSVERSGEFIARGRSASDALLAYIAHLEAAASTGTGGEPPVNVDTVLGAAANYLMGHHGTATALGYQTTTELAHDVDKVRKWLWAARSPVSIAPSGEPVARPGRETPLEHDLKVMVSWIVATTPRPTRAECIGCLLNALYAEEYRQDSGRAGGEGK